jgi:hypothetical protein
MDVLPRYAESLAAAKSKLVIVSANQQIHEQLTVTGIMDLVGSENVYEGDKRVGAKVRRAQNDAAMWIQSNRRGGI